MKTGEIRSWEPGDLVQIKRALFMGRGVRADSLGIVIGPSGDGHWSYAGRLDVLFADGIRKVIPNVLEGYGSSNETVGGPQ
jgi:hypothetical protein